MGILADYQIQEEVRIEPFEQSVKRTGCVSYGVSSYGYDVRVGSKFKIFTNVNSEVVDPKNFSPRGFVDVDADTAGHVLIPPNSFALCETVEYFEIPRNILAICVGKSTYARCGIIVNVTPLEPEWKGRITIEISNTTPLPAKIYANEGIAQIIFLRGEKSLPHQLCGQKREVPESIRSDATAGGLTGPDGKPRNTEARQLPVAGDVAGWDVAGV